jgi:hypothetical protein
MVICSFGDRIICGNLSSKDNRHTLAELQQDTHLAVLPASLKKLIIL